MPTSIQAQAAVLFFDTTSRVTYMNIPKWHAEVSRVCPDATCVLVRTLLNHNL
jgi:GTP-binding nuclear protein Ran